MIGGVEFKATREAIERARLVFPRQIYDHLVDDILNAVARDEGAMAERFAELGQAEQKPDHIATPLDGGDPTDIMR